MLTAAREQYDVYVVQDLEDFVAENRYPTAQSINADGSIIDMELVNAYDQKLTEYTAHGGTADATDAYAYAEKVVSLKQYEPQRISALRRVDMEYRGRREHEPGKRDRRL